MAITSKLKDIADAIRKQNGTSELMKLDEMDDAIRELQGADIEKYEGNYTVSPSFEPVILDTDSKQLLDDIVVQPISVQEVGNNSNGKTLII